MPVTTPQAVVHEMARQIDALASDRARLRQMSEAAYGFATTQQWDRRAVLIEQLYHQVLTGVPREFQLATQSGWRRQGWDRFAHLVRR